MTMDIDYTGEDYAFPSDFTVVPAKGMTKRQYIATALFAGMLANGSYEGMDWDMRAYKAVVAADALIKELSA